jgi:Flp pilus assembly protein TadB
MSRKPDYRNIESDTLSKQIPEPMKPLIDPIRAPIPRPPRPSVANLLRDVNKPVDPRTMPQQKLTRRPITYILGCEWSVPTLYILSAIAFIFFLIITLISSLTLVRVVGIIGIILSVLFAGYTFYKTRQDKNLVKQI